MLIGVTGSRRFQPRPVVGAVLRALQPSSVFVGCARGADKAVRQAFPSARVFRAAGPLPHQLVARSVSLVHAVAAGSGLMLGFPVAACPSACAPGPAWSGSGSGTWGSLALAAGLGCTVLVFWPGPGQPPAPHWPGLWVRCSAHAGLWRFSPGPVCSAASHHPAQLALF